MSFRPSSKRDAFFRISDRSEKGRARTTARRRRLCLDALEDRVLLTTPGTWTTVTASGTGPSGAIALMLLSNGSVMAQGPASGPAFSPTTSWYELTPDSSGNYATGSWTQLASMSEARRFSTTAMLPNGDVFIVGGEYSSPDPFTNSAEIFDPTANGGTGSWTTVDGAPTPATNIDLSGTISGASNTSPIVITSTSTSQLQNGQQVVISGVHGNTAANGTFTVAGLTPTTFELEGSTGNGSYVDPTGSITGASDASPIVITASTTTGLSDGDSVTISGVTGNTAANGTWTISGLTGTTFNLVNSTGNGTYASGGTYTSPGSWNAYASQFGDDPIEVLPVGSNGQSEVLAGYYNDPTTYLFNPANPSGSQWTTTSGSKLANDRSDEETWVKLADGSILSYDVFASMGGTFQAQRYVPSTDTWVDASTLSTTNPPSILSDPSSASNGGEGAELGPGFLQPNGSVIIFGANGNTAIYTPNSSGGVWSAGPQEPKLSGHPTGCDR